jgi:signal transduction histidine kinase
VALGLFNSGNVLYGIHGYPLALRVADVACGATCLVGIGRWRVRRPVGFAVFGFAVGMFSTLAGGVGMVGVFTVAVQRRWKTAIAVSVLGALSLIPTVIVYPGGRHLDDVLVGALITFGVTGWGMFVRARRLLVASLQAQVAHAEQSAEGRAEAARRAERERIAREMHDVLAHRLSMLSVHAGALEFHPDATPQEVADAAGVIRVSARESLNDLRSLISLLRGDDAGALPERPQPTLSDVPALVDESRQAGLAVSYRQAGDLSGHPGDLSPATGRTLYRVIQEALMNVRKHAVYGKVDIDLAGQRGDGIQLCVRNQIIDPANEPDARPVPGSGSGLIGLRERTTLAGGHLEYGPTDDGLWFVVRAWLPWTPLTPDELGGPHTDPMMPGAVAQRAAVGNPHQEHR